MGNEMNSMFKIIIIESPYFTLRDSSLARELFGKVLGVRLNAYLQDYGEGVLPLGKEDFLSDLVIICQESKSELVPIYSFKITSFKTCETFKLTFPLISMLEDRYQDDVRLAKIKSFVENKLRSGKHMAYFGSRNKSVEVNWDEESAKILNGIGICALVEASNYFGLDEFVLFAMLNRNAFKYCEKLGMERLLQDTITVDSLGHSEAYIMHHTQFSESALAMSKSYYSYWENRIHVGVSANVLKKAS
jgi:hypothetical protein